MPPRRGPITKIVGGGIGLAQEAMAHHQETKASRTNAGAATGAAKEETPVEHDPNALPSYEEIQHDVAHWELDDAQREASSDNDKSE